MLKRVVHLLGPLRALAILELCTAVSGKFRFHVALGFSYVVGNSVTHANAKFANLLTGLLGIVVPANTAIGLTCHPLSVVGIGGNHW